MTAVVTAMANPESGLEVRDRMWLKITIANAFIGEDTEAAGPPREDRDNHTVDVTITSSLYCLSICPSVRPGSDVVDWLHRNVDGFTDRREARKYAGNLLKAGYIRHTVSKVTFSEQCYYVFGDLCAGESRTGQSEER